MKIKPERSKFNKYEMSLSYTEATHTKPLPQLQGCRGFRLRGLQAFDNVPQRQIPLSQTQKTHGGKGGLGQNQGP